VSSAEIVTLCPAGPVSVTTHVVGGPRLLADVTSVPFAVTSALEPAAVAPSLCVAGTVSGGVAVVSSEPVPPAIAPFVPLPLPAVCVAEASLPSVDDVEGATLRSGALEDGAVTLPGSTVPASPVVVVTVGGEAGAVGSTGGVLELVSSATENQPSALPAAGTVVGGSVVGVESVAGAVVAAPPVVGAAALVGGTAGAAAGVGVGRLRGDPTESLTTGTFANGSLGFFAAVVGAGARCECVSDTTGTRCRTPVVAACAGEPAFVFVARGSAGSGACMRSFGI
jgi:hypothetical protein